MNSPAMLNNLTSLDVEDAVRDRYSLASHAAEACLCCAVQYDQQLLKVLPGEILERDYGCGDPTRDVQTGETVIDLGSGGGKVCFIASQIVGPGGRVIGVDMNDDMLALARRYQPDIVERIGWRNIGFHKARIQDLTLDLDRLQAHLDHEPVNSAARWLETLRLVDHWRREEPLIPTATADVVLSNCVLNLVHPDERRQLFAELYRVLKPTGRAVISDIVSDRPVPVALQQDAKLWSGCISGAFEESQFMVAFRSAGFDRIELVARQEEPWQIIDGIEFRSVTVRAWKSACDLVTLDPTTNGRQNNCCGQPPSA